MPSADGNGKPSIGSSRHWDRVEMSPTELMKHELPSTMEQSTSFSFLTDGHQRRFVSWRKRRPTKAVSVSLCRLTPIEVPSSILHSGGLGALLRFRIN